MVPRMHLDKLERPLGFAKEIVFINCLPKEASLGIAKNLKNGFNFS